MISSRHKLKNQDEQYLLKEISKKPYRSAVELQNLLKEVKNENVSDETILQLQLQDESVYLIRCFVLVYHYRIVRISVCHIFLVI